MKNLIVANWKMNPVSRKEAESLFENIKNGILGTPNDVVICPPYPYLPLFKGLPLGAQNSCFEEKGAFTGEVSTLMLKDMGIDYVIIGHSERRKFCAETDQVINRKIKAALCVGLKAILCVGETAEERDRGQKNEVLERQITEDLKDIFNDGISSFPENLSIAYEPVWAIGTGNNCSIEETKKSAEFIKKLFEAVEKKSPIIENVKVLYGGSVTSQNSGDYIKQAGVDGLLVGGASLNAQEFVKIVKSAE